jgi:hypothetical protein
MVLKENKKENVLLSLCYFHMNIHASHKRAKLFKENFRFRKQISR